MKKIFAIMLIALLTGCSASNVPDIKAHATEAWAQAGFKVVGYEGYEWTGFGMWGGCVWYTVQRKHDDKVMYHGCVTKWGDEYHLYGIKALDALVPNASN